MLPPRRDAATLLAHLKTAFIEAGWLVDMEITDTEWGQRVSFPTGLGLDHAEELALTIEAGTEKRIIRK